MKAVCGVCPRRCAMEEGALGFCRARRNVGGEIVCDNYSRVTALALDPIEKKPFRRFRPGSRILSIGSYGCNMACPFCQNSAISMADETNVGWENIGPLELVNQAQALTSQGNIGIAFTYNEPLVGYEFVRDTAKLAKVRGLVAALVTNGMILQKPWAELLPLIDAANIDLKAFNADAYRALGGDLQAVKDAISLAAGRIHLELTTLIVPGLSDSVEDMRREAEWIASLSPDIPLHLSRFFPRYRMREAGPTPVDTLARLAEIAGEFLRYVYLGNC